MDARTFLKKYKYDERLITGDYYPAAPLQAELGDTIGVVLMNLGGPDTVADVEPFLYNLFMDPAIIDLPFGGILRHWLSKFISTRRSQRVGHDYQKIGGGSPINRLTREQAESLERELNQSYGKAAGVKFRVYIAMRYWHPTTEEAAAQMQRDGVTKVVLLPLYPQYSKTTTGSSLVYWWMLEQNNEIQKWPTAYVYEYAAHPKFVQAISARIDEGLKRFSKEVRGEVQLVFSAHGTPLYEMKKRRDPYCCLIHSTVEQVMNFRQRDLPFHVAFQSKVGPAEWLTPSTPDKLKELAEAGHKTVLIVPVAFVTDHIETLFELNMLIRDQAQEFGIQHYEVTSGLNSHPLFIEALAEATVSQAQLPSNLPADRQAGGQLRPIQELPARLSAQAGQRPSADADPPSGQAGGPKFSEAKRTTRCHQCEHIAEAVCWEGTAVESAV
ncbi:MAG TPA: ferrochelatase [bacterium]